jgi:hypothetical protein
MQTSRDPIRGAIAMQHDYPENLNAQINERKSLGF